MKLPDRKDNPRAGEHPSRPGEPGSGPAVPENDNVRKRYQVYIVDSSDVSHGDDDSIEQGVLRDCADVRLVLLRSEEEFEPYSSRADAIILWHHLQFTADVLSKLSRTRLIVRNGVGFDNVDIAAAGARGIRVANVPDYGTEEVADHAMALTLALIRQLRPLMADVSKGGWEWRVGLDCWRIRGRVFGVVGCGRIGTAAALRAKALGFDVRFYDPYLASGYEKAIGVQRSSSLEELLSVADVVSVHVPLSEETRHLIATRELTWMKKSAYLVNTARGPVISHEALVDALSRGAIAGAALDVLENEPSGVSELLTFPNCIATPHSAFYSRESMVEMRTKSALIVRDALLHGRYINVVNQEAILNR
ncbi:MAG: C-terminal binding protein [Bryobacteraceae bacterium]